MNSERNTFNNARLPEDLEEFSLKSMEVGDSSWAVPWAMEVDSQRRCWLKASFKGFDVPGGTVSMFVIRVEEGFIVDLSEVKDYKWSTGHTIDDEDLEDQDPDNPEWLPVIRINR